MTGLGLGEIFGAIGIGYLVDKYGSKKTVIINLLLLILSIVITLIILNISAPLILTIVMTFLWGIHDGAISSHTSEMLGF